MTDRLSPSQVLPENFHSVTNVYKKLKLIGKIVVDSA